MMLISGLKRLIKGQNPLIDNEVHSDPVGTQYLYAALAVFSSTLIAIPLEAVITNTNVVLIYVLSVIITGLKKGWKAAVLGSLLAFFSFNYFFTEPRYSFRVIRNDELTTLGFLLLIALLCGAAASRIRDQFIQLRHANRFSELMGELGRSLSTADSNAQVWQALERVINIEFQAKCFFLGRQGYISNRTWNEGRHPTTNQIMPTEPGHGRPLFEQQP